MPVALKQKNNLIQPKNIKVKLRTSSKQIGIKHGKVKQKLLALETRNEESDGTATGLKNKINVDHTKEFHKLLGKENETGSISKKKALTQNKPKTTSRTYPVMKHITVMI